MNAPTLAEIRDAKEKLSGYVVTTPVWQWRNQDITEVLGADTKVFLKLELFQHTGSFKPRGALMVMLGLDPEAMRVGVTTVSAGNHAIAVSYAAQVVGTTAKVVMPKSANPIRIARCKSFGGLVELVDDVHQAFERVRQIENQEGRVFVHPFEGPLTATGTATVGFEFCDQVPDLETVIIPIGGGGLCAGISTSFKLMQPHCRVIGVEPEGADTMHRSFASGKPESIPAVRTIADSLGAPFAEPYSFSLCRQNVDELVMVDDDEIRRAMALLFKGVKLAVEPAGAAATSALIGPLRDRLRGQRVGLIVSGTNIDINTFATHVQAAQD